MRHLKPIIVLFCVLILPASALAAVDFNYYLAVKANQPIKAMTPSFDGERLFVLGQDSVLYIYDAAGKELGQKYVDPRFDMISLSGFEKAKIPEFIFLSSSKTGDIQRISYDPVATFDVAHSPFIGNPEAKITVVIFSDFQ